MTPKQQRFVAEYAVDLNATQAAIRAGYSPHTARVQGSALLTNPDIAAAVAERNGQVITRLEVTTERVLREYARIAFSDMRRFATVTANGGVNLVPSDQWSDDDAAAVAELGETVTEKGGSVRFKLHSKPQALDALARHLGMFANSDGEPDRHLHVHVMGQLSVDDLRRLASGDAQS
jgi:phage terminase small subunit